MNETTTYTEQQLDDWGNIFGASAGMWSWWQRIEHVTGDWDTPGHLVLAIDDPDKDGVVRKIVTDPMEVFDSLRRAMELYPHLYQRHYGELDLDASSADVVLQVLIFGEAVYG